MLAERYLQQLDLYRYGMALEQVHRENPGANGAALLEKVAGVLANNLFSDNQKKILQMFSDKQLPQKELDLFLDGWDIEAVQSWEALLLACIQKEHPQLQFGTYNGPRLSGLAEYNKFRSLELQYYFSRIINAFHTEQIFPIILNHNLLLSRHPKLFGMLQNLDLLIPSEADDEAVIRIVSRLGYRYGKENNSLTIHINGKTTNGKIRILSKTAFAEDFGHKFAAMLLARAVKQDLFRVKTLVPSTEDMVVLCLSRIAGSIRSGCSLPDLFFSVAGLIDLIHQANGLSWDLLMKEIQCDKKTAECILGADFVNHIVPKLIPTEVVFDKRYDLVLNQLAKNDKKTIRRAFHSTLAKQYTVIISRLKASRKL